ncbi:MAG TPA: hypothetical protein VES42_13110 [Pilimelia sp.]|nr:hypothetical protein [Pilimelia sp.]
MPTTTGVDSAPEGSRSRRRENIAEAAALLGLASPLIGIVLTETKDDPRALLPISLIGLGFFVLALRWTPVSFNRVAPLFAGTAVLSLGFVTWTAPWYFVGSPVSGAAIASAAPAPPDVTIIEPSATGFPVNGCVTIRFTAAAPEGYTFVVANNRQNEADYYFEAEVAVDPGRTMWSANMTLGSSGSGMGELFSIVVVMLPEAEAAYLLETHTKGNQTWWAAKGLPPTGQEAAKVTVRRDRTERLAC